jgi:hypothetical protein
MISIKKNFQKTPFHLVDPSLWPFIAASGAFFLTFGTVLFMHHVNLGNQLAFLGLFIIILSMFGWWQNIIFETYNEGNHTAAVQLGLRFGMLLFIISEVMFFFGFFWAFFHASLSPSIEIGAV